MLERNICPAVYGFVWIATMALGFFFLAGPYYILGSSDYVPKNDPARGFFVPKTPLAWFFLSLGLVLILFSTILLALFVFKNRAGKPQKWAF